jgi:hypothetical protein
MVRYTDACKQLMYRNNTTNMRRAILYITISEHKSKEPNYSLLMQNNKKPVRIQFT